MLKYIKYYILSIAILIFLHLNVVAQIHSTLKSDSINATLIKNYDVRLKQIAQQRSEDSLRKIELEKELSQLKTSDNLKKAKLQQQLEAIVLKEEMRLREKKERIDSLRSSARKFPVLGFFNDTLFLIYNKLGSFTAKDRALAISERIHRLKDDYLFTENSLSIVPTESSLDLVYGESILMSVSETDAIWNNTTALDLAKEYKKLITAAVLEFRKETSVSTLVKEVALALLVLALLVLVLYFIGRLFKLSEKRIIQEEGKRLKSFKIRNYTVLDSSRLVNFISSLNSLLKWMLYLLVVYIALPIIFGFFPWTQNFAHKLFAYILNPLSKMAQGFVNYLPNLFTIAVIFMVFRYALRGIHFLKNEIEQSKLSIPGFYPDWANPTFQILRVVLYAFMFVLIFPYLPGSDSPIFQGVSVFLGFLLTFGSAGSLSNIVAGIVLTYMRLFKIGDRVKIGEVVGDVMEKSMLVTRIKTIKNEIVSIPNSTVMSSHTINYSQEVSEGRALIVHTTVTIGYDVPWKDMYSALLNAAKRTQGLLKDPEPFVLQTSLDDFYVSYQINAYTREPGKQALIYSELHQHIQDSCNEAGIEILSPHYRAARDGNTTTIPAHYLGKDYQAPSFRVTNQK